MPNSKRKGKNGELEAAKEIGRLFGTMARRGQQFSGSPDSPDIVTGLSGIHFEVKRVEAFRLYDALSQASGDASEDDIPVVLHRKNGEKWVAVLYLEDLPEAAARLLDDSPKENRGYL